MATAAPQQTYLSTAHSGAVILGAALVARAVQAPAFLQGLPLGMLVVVVALLFRSSMRDEYVERLWNAGTAAGLFAALVATLGIELMRGFADPAVDVFVLPPLLTPLDVASVVLAAFFTAFHLTLLRDRA